jgi:hypothetical protein
MSSFFGFFWDFFEPPASLTAFTSLLTRPGNLPSRAVSSPKKYLITISPICSYDSVTKQLEKARSNSQKSK